MLYDQNHSQIWPADAIGKTREEIAQMATRADLYLGSSSLIVKVLTIDIAASNIVDHDDEPLTSAEIEGVIVDLNRYTEALD